MHVQAGWNDAEAVGSGADCPFAGTVGPVPLGKTLAGRPAPGSVSRGAGWLHGVHTL